MFAARDLYRVDRPSIAKIYTFKKRELEMSSAGVSITQALKLREVYRGAAPKTMCVTLPVVRNLKLSNEF